GLFEGTAGNVGGGDVVVAARATCLKDRDDVRVVQAAGSACLAQKALDRLGVLQRPWLRHLEGHLAVELWIVDKVNGPERAGPQTGAALEAAQPLGEVFAWTSRPGRRQRRRFPGAGIAEGGRDAVRRGRTVLPGGRPVECRCLQGRDRQNLLAVRAVNRPA